MTKIIKRTLTDDEYIAIAAMRCVRFPVASWDKRFFRNVLEPALIAGELSDKAAAQLWRIFIKYRRQTHKTQFVHNGGTIHMGGAIWENLMAISQKQSAPDYRKQAAASNEQARIDALKAKMKEVA